MNSLHTFVSRKYKCLIPTEKFMFTMTQSYPIKWVTYVTVVFLLKCKRKNLEWFRMWKLCLKQRKLQKWYWYVIPSPFRHKKSNSVLQSLVNVPYFIFNDSFIIIHTHIFFLFKFRQSYLIKYLKCYN